MATPLAEQFSDVTKRDALIQDALGVLDAEVGDKSGLSGMAIKTAFRVIKGIQPGFLRSVVERLLPDFVEKLDPVYQDALKQGLAPGALLTKEKSKVAGALLSITDEKAKNAQDLVRKTYERLRPSAQKNVEAAAPRLAELLNRHAEKA